MTSTADGSPAASPVAPDDAISEIMAEFSEVFAFARARWSRYAEDVHPELRSGGMLMLQMIIRKGPVTATELGRMLEMDKAMVSRQLAKLRQLGLVEATPAPEDRRVVLLTATPEAQVAISELRHATAAGYRERFTGWQATDLQTLLALLRRFNADADAGVRVDTGPASRCAKHAAEAGTETHTD